MKHKFLLIYSWFIRSLLFIFPDIPIIMRFRGWLYGLGMDHCGRNLQITHDVILKDIQNMHIGNNCFLGNGVILMGSGKIILEEEVMIAPHAIIVSGNHTTDGKSYRYGKPDIGTIRICHGSWVAGNCTIQKDSKLPRNSVLSANSFLNKEYEMPNTIYGGVPARPIKSGVD